MKNHGLWSTRPSRPLMNRNHLFSEVAKTFYFIFFRKVAEYGRFTLQHKQVQIIQLNEISWIFQNKLNIGNYGYKPQSSQSLTSQPLPWLKYFESESCILSTFFYRQICFQSISPRPRCHPRKSRKRKLRQAMKACLPKGKAAWADYRRRQIQNSSSRIIFN